jgi:hypothetical protein
VVSNDTTEFYKEGSIEGLPDKNGRPQYVDSVYRKRNLLFENSRYLPNSGGEKWDMYYECFRARINQEDSSFVMVMPTDEAFAKIKQKIAHLYKYPSFYEDKYENEASESNKVVTRNITDPDSLMNMSMLMDLTTPLVFNVRQQPKTGSKLWEADEFIKDKGASAKYLLNTYGDTLRTTDTWDKTSIFNGNMVKMSNGYGYEATEWAFPRELYNPDIEVEANAGTVYWMKNTNIYKAGPGSRTISFNNDKFSYIADRYGKVSRNDFYYIAPKDATTNPTIEFALTGNLPSTSDIVTSGQYAEVMSGKYDIMVVMVPYWYTSISDAETVPERFHDQAYIDSIAATQKMSFSVKVRNNTNKGKADVLSSSSPVFEYDGTKVDTITVWKDYEFPYSYKNLRFTYPTLQITGATKKSGSGSTTVAKGFIFGLYIDRILLKSKETGEVTSLDPQ